MRRDASSVACRPYGNVGCRGSIAFPQDPFPLQQEWWWWQPGPRQALHCLAWPWAEGRRGAAKHPLISLDTCFCWHVCAVSRQQLADITVFVQQDEVAGFCVIASLLDTFHYTHFCLLNDKMHSEYFVSLFCVEKLYDCSGNHFCFLLDGIIQELLFVLL